MGSLWAAAGDPRVSSDDAGKSKGDRAIDVEGPPAGFNGRAFGFLPCCADQRRLSVRKRH